MTMFYAMVNIASVNSFKLYLCYRCNSVLTRLQFVKQLAFELVEPHIRRRLRQTNIRADLKKTTIVSLAKERFLKRTVMTDCQRERLAVFVLMKRNERPNKNVLNVEIQFAWNAQEKYVSTTQNKFQAQNHIYYFVWTL